MQEQAIDSRFLYSDRMRHITRYIMALITGLVGIADMLSAIAPKLNWDILLGVWMIHIPQRVPAQTLTVVVGFFLIMLSYGLLRGKSHAWRLTLLLLLLSAFLHIVRRGSILSTAVALALALLLCILVRFFQAKSDPPCVWRGYIVLTLGFGIVAFYTIGGFITLYDDFKPLVDRFGIEGVILRMLTSVHLHFPRGTPAFFFEHALPVLCVSAVLYGMLQLFRPVAATLLPDNEIRAMVNEKVHLYGKNSISYFALDPEKCYFFSQSGRSVISYVLQGSTAVVAGDPIGPDEEVALTIHQFKEFCREQDWTIVFWQVRGELADTYRNNGLRLLKIGEDAIITTSNFTLKGGAMANVRSSAKRAEKDGVHITFYQGQITDAEQLAQMEQISRAWLQSKGGSEMGFSMGRFDPQGDLELVYAVAVDTHNKVHAFVTFVPIYGRNGWGLDLMRRTESCAPGTMELLLARSIEHLKSRDAAIVSLGLAPLGNVNNEDETFLGTSIDFLTERFGNPRQNQSLFKFKKKFQPSWESRYLVYSDALSLPKIGWALYYAHERNASLLRLARKALAERQQKDQAETQPGSATGPLETAKI